MTYNLKVHDGDVKRNLRCKRKERLEREATQPPEDWRGKRPNPCAARSFLFPVSARLDRLPLQSPLELATQAILNVLAAKG